MSAAVASVIALSNDGSNEIHGVNGPVRFRAMSTESAPESALDAVPDVAAESVGASSLEEAPRRSGLLASAQLLIATRLYSVVGGIVAVAAILIDQATKHWADVSLVRGRYIAVAGERFGWQLTFNDGGAWGFPAPSWFFLVVTVVVVVIVVRNLPLATSGRGASAYGLLLAGAVGNALDRVFRVGDAGDPRFLFGHVVDFVAVELPRWFGPLGGAFPRFNIADVAITIGFVLLAWELLVTPEPGEDAPETAAVQDGDGDNDAESGTDDGETAPTGASLPVSVS